MYRVCDGRCWDALQKNALCLSLLRVLELTDPDLYYEAELDLKVLSKATHLTHLIRLSVHPYLVEDDVVAMSLANAPHLVSLETFDFGEYEPLSVPLSVLCKSPFLKDCVLESFRGHMDDFDAEQQFWMEVSGL